MSFICMVKRADKFRRPRTTFLVPLCEINYNTIHLSFAIYFGLQELPYVKVLDFGIWFYFRDTFYTVMFSPALQHKHRNFYQYPRLSRTSNILSTQPLNANFDGKGKFTQNRRQIMLNREKESPQK